MSIKKRNNTISLLRVIATLEIVFCHFLPNLLRGYNVPQFWATYPGIFLGNGVILFFIISGFLYGAKEINNPFRWLFRQIIKLTVPVLLLVLIESFRLLFVNGSVSINFLFVHIFNLTGLINFNLFPFINNGYNEHLSHLWYLTAIIICYLLTPIFQRIAKKKQIDSIIVIVASLCLGIVSSLFISNQELPHYFMYITVYALSYFYGRDIFDSFLRLNRVVLMVFVYVISIVAYYLSFKTIGDSLFQDSVVSQLFRTSTSFMIIAIVAFSCNKSDFCKRIQNSSVVNILDSYSYYIYIFHTYIMFVVIGDLFGINICQWYLAFPLWIIIMALVCFIDKFISDKLIKAINAKIKIK